MPSPRVNFRAIPPLDDRLAERADSPATEAAITVVARRDLERYYAALARALRDVTLTEAEASLICDAANGTLWEPHTLDLLWAEIDDAIRHDNLAAKWDVDGAELVRRLRDDLTPAERLAVVDAAERFWRLVGDGDARPTGELLRAVGLVRDGARA